MRCIECGSEAVTERSERTAQGYRRFRCRTCGKQFNERSGTLLNRAQYPLPPIIFPGRPERWWGDEALKAEPDAPQATLEQRHQAAGDVLALRCRGFFSAGALFSMASHILVETAQ